MFDVRVFNPVSLQPETVLSLGEMSEAEATVKAQHFLFSRGVKYGELLNVCGGPAISVFGFRDEDSVASASGGFGFLPSSPTYHVFEHIRRTLDAPVTSFIDLGCGPGNVLLGAWHLLGARRLTGVEIDAGLAERARANTAHVSGTIIEADLLEWVPEVNDFEMVYIYEPLRDPELRLRFLAHLKTWLNEGQYVFYQHALGEVPVWLRQVDLTPYTHPCLYTVDTDRKNK